MARPTAFVSRKIFEEALQTIHDAADAEVWQDDLPPPRTTLLEKVRGVDGLLCLLTDTIDGELMDAAGPQLKVISQIAVGYENIDVAEATRRKIPVGYTPGVLTEATADLTFALLMAVARRVVDGAQAVRDGKWKTWHPLHFLGPDVHGSTLGVIGLGRIGFEVAKRARGFNMKVIYSDVVRREDIEAEYGLTYVDMDTLLRESDYVTLHVNLTEETRHLINEDSLPKMKSSAILINAARGPVVDSKALYKALRDGVIAAAALDVTEPEPIPVDDPLLTLDNCLIVPHIASASVPARREMSRIAAQNLINGLAGEKLLTCVNPEVYG
jgi:glyoxylate reductase